MGSCATIIWRDAAKADQAAAALRLVAEDLLKLGLVDGIIPEPAGGAHADPAATIRAVGDAVEEELQALLPLTPAQIKTQRAERFLAIGR